MIHYSAWIPTIGPGNSLAMMEKIVKVLGPLIFPVALGNMYSKLISHDHLNENNTASSPRLNAK